MFSTNGIEKKSSQSVCWKYWIPLSTYIHWITAFFSMIHQLQLNRQTEFILLSAAYPYINFTFLVKNSFTIRTVFKFKDNRPLYIRSNVIYKCLWKAAMYFTLVTHSRVRKLKFTNIGDFHRELTEPTIFYHLLFQHPVNMPKITRIHSKNHIFNYLCSIKTWSVYNRK